MNKTAIEVKAEELTGIVTRANEAFKAEDLKGYYDGVAKAKECVKQYNELLKQAAFAGYKKSADPIKAALVSPTYLIHAIKESKEDGVLMGIEDGTKDARINLGEFFKFLGEATTWKSLVGQYAQVMRIKVAEDLGLTYRDVALEYGTSINMERIYSDLAKFNAKESEVNPISANQMAKRLQEILDKVYFVDNSKGQNKFLATSADVKFMLYAFTKQDTNAVSVLKLVTDKAVENMLVDVLHKMVCGINYRMTFKDKSKAKDAVLTKYDPEAPKKEETAPVATSAPVVVAPAPAPEKKSKKAGKKSA